MCEHIWVLLLSSLPLFLPRSREYRHGLSGGNDRRSNNKKGENAW